MTNFFYLIPQHIHALTYYNTTLYHNNKTSLHAKIVKSSTFQGVSPFVYLNHYRDACLLYIPNLIPY